MMKITLSGCTASSMSEDGSIFVKLDAQPSGVSESVDELIDYHTTLTGGGRTTNLDFELELSDTTETMNVKVDDGHVTIERSASSIAANLEYSVHARGAVYTCTRWQSGGGTCVGPSNETRVF
jgi:hypothetical protein